MQRNCAAFGFIASLAIVFVAVNAISDDVHADQREQQWSALELIAQPGPWNAVSGLIAYRQRVWFVNSTKFVNHNSADVYSYEAESRTLQFERHLFSQDLGTPAIVAGLLYWPFEDSRFSSALGEYAVTDGKRWQWHLLPRGKAFHNHVMHVHDDALYAATSAWKARVHRKLLANGGGPWVPVYEHPTPPGRVSRITSLASFAGQLYAGLTQRSPNAGSLLRLRNESFVPVPGWPNAARTDELTPFRGWLYAITSDSASTRVVRTNGKRVHTLATKFDGAVQALAADEDHLYAVAGQAKGGRLWRSRNGTDWTPLQRFPNALPVDVLAVNGDVYVGTFAASGRGALWGPVPPRPIPSGSRVEKSIALTGQASPIGRFETRLTRTLDDALNSTDDFATYRQALIDALLSFVFAQGNAVSQPLVDRLIQPYSQRTLLAIGGATSATMASFNRWYLLWAIGLIGDGHVPLTLFEPGWNIATNAAEKYFGVLPAAAWTASMLSQRDTQTVSALVDALGHASHPLWLTGDLVGALSATSKRQFGYDVSQWKRWWQPRRSMVLVRGDVFTMGSNDGEPAEAPPHQVQVADFFLDRHEVSQGDFATFVRETHYRTDAERNGWGWHWQGQWQKLDGATWRRPHHGAAVDPNHPVTQVSWNDAKAYCAWAGKSLPSEAQWEFAARGTEGRTFAWGNEPPDAAGVSRTSYGSNECCAPDDADGYLYSAPVNSFVAGVSPLGFYHLTGNVWEWVEDSFRADYYQHAEFADPVNRSPRPRKVIRGGGWGNNPWGLRATLRHHNLAHHGLSMVGFRCAARW